jgi:hypothetical protein
LHPAEAIGVNGVLSVVVAPVLVRLDTLRKGRTYELLITSQAAGQADDGRRLPLQTKVLFRGVHCDLELDLSEKTKRKPVQCCRHSIRCPAKRLLYQTSSGQRCSQSSRRELWRLLPLSLCQHRFEQQPQKELTCEEPIAGSGLTT